MGNETKNYKFPKPEEDDFYDIKEYNKAMDILDETLTGMDNKKLDKNGDISDTKINLLETVTSEFPVPTEGETTKVFMGKVKKFIENTKPLESDTTYYVATTGSDVTGDGSAMAPYATITKALSVIPKDLGGFSATVDISEGIYTESIDIQNFLRGTIKISLSGDVTVQDLQIINSYVICTTSGNVNTLTLAWIYLTAKANVYSSDLNFQIHTTGAFTSSDTPSIFIFDGSDFYIPGLITLDTHTGIAVEVQHHSKAYLGSAQGTGFDIGFGVYFGGICTCINNNLSATKPIVATSGGMFIKSSGSVVGTLQSNVTYYVATTGSNITGNGTQANPFKTIQYAIDILPKDLGGYSATINIASGIYNESVRIYGFQNGVLYVNSDTQNTLADTCKVKSMNVRHINGYVQLNGLTFTDMSHTVLEVWSSIIRVNYCQTTVPSLNTSGFYFGESTGDVYACKIANRNIALSLQNSRICSNSWNSGSTGNTYSSNIYLGSILTKTGSQPTGIEYASQGSMFINENGTQISNLITSGLSCTWGTISGGYVRHGNLNGPAMVTICVHIVNTVELTGGQEYRINGFPKPSTPMGMDIAVASNSSPNVNSWLRTADGAIGFASYNTRPIGTVLQFNVTYPTNQ
ncbi:hypothetical protein [Clostridium sp. Marseille-P2415]|uniref:hypothetical protein n=1 Tax=Clostridium sp. Marseille-P2415 TaxID=1805471 RepID=UPI0009883316|nr:hypothetical protein [Clostridium sp. Marseille-P2415]